jgi:imidazoleglycerol phosphate synthase glutamine amidotransferase subunit HisH
MTPMQSVLEIYQIVLPGVGGKSSIAAKVLKVKGCEALQLFVQADA